MEGKFRRMWGQGDGISRREDAFHFLLHLLEGGTSYMLLTFLKRLPEYQPTHTQCCL